MANNIVLIELTFFDQISALQQRVFHENLKTKMTWDHRVFQNERFLMTKKRHKSNVFFRELTFVNKIWAWDWRFFRENSEKKGILLTFMVHNIFIRFDRIDVFWQNKGFKAGGYSWQIWKSDMRASCFGRMKVFLTKHAHESTVVLENGRF